LAMRVGLHSGSVTGGVLRGQKSRFQLFGDTMNTASRMESNGLPNRIHASQETADALIAKGKSAWITPRDDKIVAKGKGELQTFWVSIRKSDVASVMSSSKASGSGYGGAEIASLSGPKNESEHRTFEI
jgi:class 3 adenylate cyclase